MEKSLILEVSFELEQFEFSKLFSYKLIAPSYYATNL